MSKQDSNTGPKPIGEHVKGLEARRSLTPALTTSEARSRPATSIEIKKHLAELSLFFHQSDLNPSDATLKVRLFAADLQGVSEPVLAQACKRYRCDPKSRFFPTPGQLLALCRDEQHYDKPPAVQAIPGPIATQLPPHPCPVPQLTGTLNEDRKSVVDALESLAETRAKVPVDNVVYLENISAKYPPRRIGVGKNDKGAA